MIYASLKSTIERSLEPHGTADAKADAKAGAKAGGALPTWARFFAGGGANVLNIGLWYPLNTCLHYEQSDLPVSLRRQVGAGVQPGPQAGSRGLQATARRLLAEGGVARFYRGFAYAMLRAGPVAAVIMPCFELVLPWLERRVG